MPWKIEHVCHLGQTELQDYAVMKGTREPIGDLTRVVCPNCREEFYIVGHEMFSEAAQTNIPGGSLPPGFIVARSRIS